MIFTRARVSLASLVSLSKDVFERLTSTGSGLFSFLDGGFTQIFGQIVSIMVKTLRNTNLVASRCFKMKKTSLPVDVRRSKTPFSLLSLRENEGLVVVYGLASQCLYHEKLTHQEG